MRLSSGDTARINSPGPIDPATKRKKKSAFPLPKSQGWHAVIAEADREALWVESEWVGTHHLLLALTGENGGAASQVLARHGLEGGLLADHLWVVGRVVWPEGAAEVL